ncbi:MAG: hypothetical protein DSY55_04085 [Clostridia bacterium]|nr:MAG: hypothetical protein DSY55_04085 [Clostridia bacterium]
MKQPHSSLPGPHNIITGHLSNGLTVWVYENFDTETVALEGYAVGGTINESAEQAGLASFVAAMLRRGTQKHSFDRLNEIVESVGASFGFDSGRHTLAFDSYSLAEDFEMTLALLAESLLYPDFPAEELEKTRSHILTRIEEQKHSTRARASQAFRQHIYPLGHPYRSSMLGEEGSVRQFKRDDLAHFFTEKISPQNGIVVVVGAIQAGKAISLLEKAVGAWQHPQAHPDLSTPPPPLLMNKIERNVTVHGKSQSDLIMGWPGIARSNPDYLPMLVCNSILGSFGLGGRLGSRVREELGLAYYIYSSFSANKGAGTWRAVAGVNRDNMPLAIETILTEAARIVGEPVSDEELQDVQSNLIGSLPLQMETNSGIAGRLINMAWYDLGQDYLLNYAKNIRAVGKEDILRVAQTYLDPECYVLAVAGPPPEAS